MSAHRHQQAFDAHGDTGACRHAAFERRQEIHIDRQFRHAAFAAARVVALEASPLFGRVGEFVIAVGEFVHADVDLEAFGNAVADLRERALRRRIVDDDGDAIARERGLDAMRQQQVEPVVARQATRIDRVFAERGAKCFFGIGKRIDSDRRLEQIAIRRLMHVDGFADAVERRADQLDRFVGQPAMIASDAIPLQHREFRIVPPPSFAVAEDAAEFVAIADTGGEQTLLREFARRAQPAFVLAAKSRRETLDVRIGVRAGRQDRRFDFEHVAFGEKLSDQRVQIGATPQRVAQTIIRFHAEIPSVSLRPRCRRRVPAPCRVSIRLPRRRR